MQIVPVCPVFCIACGELTSEESGYNGGYSKGEECLDDCFALLAMTAALLKRKAGIASLRSQYLLFQRRGPYNCERRNLKNEGEHGWTLLALCL
jgi:hypothetical protein